jgi:SnoaL-like domain
MHGMTQRKAANGLNFEALRLGIERCDPDLVLSFFADDAQLSIVNAQTQQRSPFELRGKAEIAKHLRAVFSQETSHRVEREVVGDDRATFREVCEYPDGSRVLVETTLEVRDGKIVRQVEVVSTYAQVDREGAISQRSPTRKPHPNPHPGAEVSPSDRFLRSKQATEKEEIR